MLINWRFLLPLLCSMVLCAVGAASAQLPATKNPSAVSSTASSSEQLTCGGFPVSKDREPDFGPYIAELQRRIWSNSKSLPEKGRTVVHFYIDCAGNLSGLAVAHSSGNLAKDQAALKAIQDSAPFKSLPAEASSKTPIPVTFIFGF